VRGLRGNNYWFLLSCAGRASARLIHRTRPQSWSAGASSSALADWSPCSVSPAKTCQAHPMRSDEQASLTGPLFTDYALLPDLGVGLDLAPSDRNTLMVPTGLGTCGFHSSGAENCSDLVNLLTVQAPGAVTHGMKCGDSGHPHCNFHNSHILFPFLHRRPIQ